MTYTTTTKEVKEAAMEQAKKAFPKPEQELERTKACCIFLRGYLMGKADTDLQWRKK